jgi:hypothetical protein
MLFVRSYNCQPLAAYNDSQGLLSHRWLCSSSVKEAGPLMTNISDQFCIWLHAITLLGSSDKVLWDQLNTLRKLLTSGVLRVNEK